MKITRKNCFSDWGGEKKGRENQEFSRTNLMNFSQQQGKFNGFFLHEHCTKAEGRKKKCPEKEENEEFCKKNPTKLLSVLKKAQQDSFLQQRPQIEEEEEGEELL